MRFFLLPVLLLSLTACTTSPLGRQQLLLMPASQMNEMGATAFAQMRQETPVISGTAQSSYVTCVANAITRVANTGDNWQVELFNSDQINAFALPGGEIGVYTGLLKVATTQDQLAAVLGHEVGHVLAQHGNERMSLELATQSGTQLLAGLYKGSAEKKQQLLSVLGLGAQYGLALPYSRTQEAEADIIGLKLMAEAGFNPQEAITLWQNMSAAAGGQQPLEILSTHPSDETRINGIGARLPEVLPLYEKARANGVAPHCQ